ncbi:MAG TPA: DUF4214 domain-containing protein [Candidatus Paceibacterota bacterium]|nr:DUF4214 domain-containing protein [Candidatus Paceibacterota bacterium]
MTESGYVPTSTAISPSLCPDISRTLKLGSTGPDVSQLQEFLAQNPIIYPEGLVTGYYGTLTQAAVERWQAINNIVSSGSPTTTGWGVVGPHTRAAIARSCSTGSTTVSSSVSTTPVPPMVGSTIQVTPISGSAPLTVTVEATLNTVSSCGAATYLLNFGDGTQPTVIPIAQNTCQSVTQTVTHTYQDAGTYTVVLSSGNYQAITAVTVNGTSSPNQTATSSIPADSLFASITSGTAPLTVVFIGTVSSPSSSACSGACDDTINFGDGAIGLVQIPTTPSTWQSYLISHTYSTSGTYKTQLDSTTGAADGLPVSISVQSVEATSTNPIIATTTSTTPWWTGTSGSVVSPTSGAAPLTVVTQFETGPACSEGYQISWGDGSAPTTQTYTPPSTGYNCAAMGEVQKLTHTYAAAGTSTITVTFTEPTGTPARAPLTATVTVAAAGNNSSNGFNPTLVPLSSITSVSAFYTALYECVLGRATGTRNDPGGLAYWVKNNSSFAILYQPYASFFDSNEYLAYKTTDQQYVTQLYECVLYRQPDQGGMNYWLTALANGTSRNSVLQDFTSGLEFQLDDYPTLESVTGLAY